MEEALQQRTFQDALAGNRMAQREVVKWIIKYEAWLAKHAPKAQEPVITRYISPDPDNADTALVLLGIAARGLWFRTGATPHRTLGRSNGSQPQAGRQSPD